MADIDSYTKQQQPVKQHNQENPSKYYRHFLYKALIVIFFFVIIPLFPSLSPEFINQTLLNKSWELLHLLFVGIAVSYGLFSRRNDETEKEYINNQSKFDNVQSFVSRFLQVSSVFDDEAENLSGFDESKVQTWSSQYYRNETPVVVAKEQAVLDEQGSSSSRIAEKPLLLPVRSLKSRVLDANNLVTTKENSANSRSLGRSNSSLSSRRFSKGTNGELGRLDQDTLVEKEKLNENNVVLPSPIPWRSRSGRMEVKDDIESEFNRLESRSFRSQTTCLSRSSSMSSSPKLSHSPPLSSPKKLSPPPLSTEAQAKSAEDSVRKKSLYRSPPPPPPPPPPLPMIQKSSSQKPISSFTADGVSFDKDLPWNFGSEPNELNGSRAGAFMGKQRDYSDGLSKGNSVKTIENRINGKRVRSDQGVSFMPKPTFMEFPQEEKKQFVEKLVVEATDDDTESDNEEVEETSFVSSIERSSNNEEASPSSGIDGGSDVDKKADEFIAKVREQIRLQRIDCIKRSSGQMKRNSTR